MPQLDEWLKKIRARVVWERMVDVMVVTCYAVNGTRFIVTKPVTGGFDIYTREAVSTTPEDKIKRASLYIKVDGVD